MDTDDLNCVDKSNFTDLLHLFELADKEYTDGVHEKIDEIISTEVISANKIRDKIELLPDNANAKLLKLNVKLLFKNGCLTKDNLRLIAGDNEKYRLSYYSNGILKILDDVKLINKENMEWILKGPSNVLFWNISLLHKNNVLNQESLQRLKNPDISKTLSNCFTHLYMPQAIEESQPSQFIASCSDTFFELEINPFAARLPPEASALGMTDASCSLGSVD
ncbi:MAG: hypothetical protein REH83_05360, partial [Rickettsiella sp.]|nr:hypothetical protein [Rickettsiella sp.]